VHPIALQLSSTFAIHWYGVMVALGFLAGLWTASRRGMHSGISGERVTDLGPWIIVGAILGARILYVISYWREQFAGKPFYEVFMIQHGGLVFYGGLIGAILAGVIYCRTRKLPLWKTADVLAPSIALGQVFGRIGCLLNGCCYGRVCNLPWAIHFPPPHETYPKGVHPTEIYESLLNLCLYGALAWLYRRKKYDGQIFAVYLVSYALIRSFVELFRGDYPPYQYIWGWITPAHLVSFGILAAGLVLLSVLPRPTAKQG
jgi:phosphatidylglycerol:prolipoprotein diacylglycerol transferase